MLEKDIQKACINYLQYQENLGKLFFIRNNSFSGQIIRKNKTIGYIKNNKAGSSDILVFLSGGRAQFWEIKLPKKKQTPNQVFFQKTIEDLGFEYYIITSVDDAENLLK